MKRILVIDDEPDILNLMRRMLEKHGYRVSCAENGKIGLQHIDHEPYDLVITDMQMPGVDGMAIIHHLSKRAPDTRIIAISGGIKLYGADNLDRAEEAGAEAILAKPFTTKEFVATVAGVLESTPPPQPPPPPQQRGD
ncbi:response regulator transcription factor [Pelodictyon luteolum]|uniref:Response regulator receiver domain protein (CheY-like) n=1 Tax=Chlorobium luteolum (strain DSM 273 / BCRC 81028 / 2530) TaxID=319225 RepID=Q3B4H6_CHLL3|nr:response regulator [Pelodictyon luteolum]ABB23755.1 response regulator receiver domain protein (CheY-like) [Pelodictyon luteolum DSM 273]